MGGIGSGRRGSYKAKDTTEDSLPLDIRKLQRDQLLTPGRSCSWEWTFNNKPYAAIGIQAEFELVVLRYLYRENSGADWKRIEQRVSIEYSDCHLGGKRPWWLCDNCGKRVAILYSPGKYFACRHCWQLAYSSQRETTSDRAARKADRIRRRLGWHVGILNPKGWKPKGMRWQTFSRLTAKHDAFVEVSLAGMVERLGLINRGLTGLLDDLGGEG